MKAIKRELGDGPEDDELEGLRRRLEHARLPAEARSLADRELRRLEGMGSASAESHVIRNHLELMSDLPWSELAPSLLDIDAVESQLASDHHGLFDVKKRILEHVAVMSLAAHTKGTLLCLVGPPGVGKTSLGQSIATATRRPFVRVALGGVRDEAEIRGHRRTYVGALPGRIISAMRKAKVKNPVVVLDEIDKLGSGWGGSPEAALLEVLDPEQNSAFVDHYLEVSFDLSHVMFLCTANSLDTLSGPLRDRLEVVELGGYTSVEKMHIAKTHLLPKRIADHGMGTSSMTVTDDALEKVIREYTREAGVRQLDRELRSLCRSSALSIARNRPQEPIVIHSDGLKSILGRPKFDHQQAEGVTVAGVATGLAWTPVGGSILFVETSMMPGKGGVEITGQLGDVMKESARAALSFVRSNASGLGIDPSDILHHDVHIHVPAGAIPKDGPSAGVTIFTALVSLFSGRRVRTDTAMTGEATLRGRVLPVGGIKAKVLSAHQAGIRRVILPERCARDLDDVPEQAKQELEIVLVQDMREVLDAALEPSPAHATASHYRPISPTTQ